MQAIVIIPFLLSYSTLALIWLAFVLFSFILYFILHYLFLNIQTNIHLCSYIHFYLTSFLYFPFCLHL
nr:MAG TPA: hypothetical protein [Bacteriophage sp.]